MNILTFDIEEWFHLLDNDSTRSEEQWKGFEVRIYENMERIFRILEETDTKATFFVIGWIAKTYPRSCRPCHRSCAAAISRAWSSSAPCMHIP